MAIQTISGKRKYMIDKDKNPLMVRVQYKHGGRWQDFFECRTPEDADRLLLELARNPYGDEDE